jgi:hypothetical protein
MYLQGKNADGEVFSAKTLAFAQNVARKQQKTRKKFGE